MILLKNVSKSFDKNIILNKINMTVNSGDIFGIIGKTGSGKSTLLRIMNGFISPDEGEIFIDNQILNKNSRMKIVKETATIFQDYNLLNNLNVINNILLPIKIRKFDIKSYNKKALELLDFVGLSHLKDSKISNLSGGEKQRVAIARALITNPKIIFCDEPTSALDDVTSYEVLSLLKTINERYQTTIILVSHNTNVIKMMCNKIAIIETGLIKTTINNKPQKLEFKTYEEVLLK